MVVKLHAVGRWTRSQVHVEWVPSGRQLSPDVEIDIAAAWTEARSRPDMHLFDGPMCRCEAFHATSELIHLKLSPTSYRIFWGTNLRNATQDMKLRAEVMANPVGISAVVQTADGWIAMGRRNDRVAYHPGRTHPFAGSLEPDDVAGGIFSAVDRELHEELSIEPREIGQVICLGMVEDVALRQPELVFEAPVSLTLQEIRDRLDRNEHDSVCSVSSDAAGLEAAISGVQQMTPVGIGALMLFGRNTLGEQWLSSQIQRMGGQALSPFGR